MVPLNGQLEPEVRKLFLTKLAVTVPAGETDLLRTGVVDSVTLVELVLALEARFEVTLPFEALEIEDFRTVGRIAALVARTAARPET